MYGEMVNALMAVKHHGSLLVDEMLESMNMPTHREINTLHRRHHETRRDLRALRSEVEQLRDELRGSSAARTAGTTHKKAPARKKIATKKTPASQPTARKKSAAKKTTVRKTTNKR
jgi:hypothetical protein